jgi:hypothetical protein
MTVEEFFENGIYRVHSEFQVRQIFSYSHAPTDIFVQSRARTRNTFHQAVVLQTGTDDEYMESAPYEEILVDIPTYLINISLNSPAKSGHKLQFMQETSATTHSMKHPSWYRCSGENDTTRCSHCGQLFKFVLITLCAHLCIYIHFFHHRGFI